jgi:hypothetical protein
MVLHYNHVRFFIVQHVVQKQIACSIVNVPILKPKSLSLEMVKTINKDFSFEKEKLSHQKGKNLNLKKPHGSLHSCTIRPTKSTRQFSIGWVGDI